MRIPGVFFFVFFNKQAATQIQEQTLQYALKFFAIVLTIFVTASLLGSSLYRFADRVMTEFPAMVRK
ncbi:EscS/YscS/HrcS family type III secretion system export apparatus protein [Schaalia cardiffensis]|uniref:EscS/YscS/HrcS family type III secretion system export apparatus protein n=1 Tax=Schaalia cardiffensis TaxID=181487 RepID=UPI0023F551C0|nr:flagellar biosynthetic protein FliQ [Schaalia cardiffensis]